MSNSETTQANAAPAYFSSLTIENVNCFKEEQNIDLSVENSRPAMWTVILGDNNTGKTTLLRCLASLEATIFNPKYSQDHYIPKIMKMFGSGFIYNLPATAIINSTIFFQDNDKFSSKKWRVKAQAVDEGGTYYSSNNSATEGGSFNNLIIYGYGASRRMSRSALSDTDNEDNTASLFNDQVTLSNIEEWILQIDYASKSNDSNMSQRATFRLSQIREILCQGLLPDVKDFRCTSSDIDGKIQNFVEFNTDYGWVSLRDLGYGYQSITTWVIDLAKKLFERYPDSKSPLHQPAIVLVDEIDLHLHPEWQRKIIQFLSEQFPQTQFIVTAHSPLIVQSADNINLVLLEKHEDHIVIKQRPEIKTFKGWTVEEILTELMGLDNRILSDDYLSLIHDFDNALDNDNYAKAKTAYDELLKILHPNSHQPKLLRLQMSSLMPDEL